MLNPLTLFNEQRALQNNGFAKDSGSVAGRPCFFKVKIKGPGRVEEQASTPVCGKVVVIYSETAGPVF